MKQKKDKKRQFKYVCEKCDFYSNNNSKYQIHLQTKKHNETNETKVKQKKGHFCNICNTEYNSRTTLWRHKKNCSDKKIEQDNIEIFNNNGSLVELMKVLIHQNDELKNSIIQICREPKITNNTNNVQFNVMNYLNTECKDAITLEKCIDNITITQKDLKTIHDYGCVKSFETCFVNVLRDMEHTKRPIHCSDAKRKNFFIKCDDGWKRDTDDKNSIIIDNLKKITDKQCDTLKQWKCLNNDWLDHDDKQEFANVVTRNIVDIYKELHQNKIISSLSTLSVKPLNI